MSELYTEPAFQAYDALMNSLSLEPSDYEILAACHKAIEQRAREQLMSEQVPDLAHMLAVAIGGLADAAIIANQTITIEHLHTAIHKLADFAKESREREQRARRSVYDEMRVLICAFATGTDWGNEPGPSKMRTEIFDLITELRDAEPDSALIAQPAEAEQGVADG